ncbi:MAG TPA: Ig-like domain repeat protein [Candidatus Acidoferrum sp.]|nr:Ig-like domain repeat protein [Candidatus Acidoferrum sp.]
MRQLKSSLLLRTAFLVFVLAAGSRQTSAQMASTAAPITQAGNAQARITRAIDERNLVTLRGNVHPLARPEFDQGPVADAQPLKRMLLLLQRSLEQETALQQLLEDQQNKSSANYHAWLTPDQFGKQFGPADADIQTITQWLTSQGFTNITAGPGRTVMEFSGTVGQVRNAFHTEIHHYVVQGMDYSANAGDPQIPAALTPVVAGVVSLNNFPKLSHSRVLGQFRHTTGKLGLEPLFTFPDPFNGKTFYGMGPGDFATIYNSKPLIAAGNDGTGQTIAIVGETNINVADVQAFRQMFGLSANFSPANVILNGEDPGITSIGEEGEADLDVEWSGATAPGATVKFVVSASTPASAGIDLSALYIIEHNLAAVMSESYGQCEAGLGTAGNAFYNTVWEQAAAQGITVILSSGDGGSAGCDDFNTQQVATHGLAVSGLASTPFNVSLGGTDFDEVNRWTSFWSASNDPVTGTSALSYIPEIPWNENCAQISLTGCGASAPNGSLNIVAGSGGQSSTYTKPKWQMGVTGMPNDNHRDQPDVSLFASPGFDGTGYVYCQSDQTISGPQTCNLNTSTGTLDFGVVGGTSASAPAFAGIMALVNQKQATPANPAPRQGNANYVLYALAKKSGASCTSSATEASTCIFNDVTKGNSFLPTGLPGVGTISVPCQGGSPNCSINIAGNNGVLVDPGHASTEAWTATAGYDMASGLGSVNVDNLATNWGTASTIGTTTTLTLSPATGITHGTAENVTVGIAVKANTGTGVPAGDVSLIATFSDGTTRGLDQFTLTNGSVANAKTQSLPGGTYTVSAHYAGDGTNASSDSTSVQVTVGSESSQAFIVIPTFDSSGHPLNGNATSFVYGTPFIVRTYVTDRNAMSSPAGPPSPTCYQENLMTCPTGNITLTDNSTALGQGTFQLNNAGYTRDLSETAATFTGGTHKLAAAYSGDGSFNASVGTSTVTVTPAPTMTQYYLTEFYAIVGQPFSIAFITNGSVPQGVNPSGTFTFYDNGTPLQGPVTTSTPGGESILGGISATFNAVGKHSITATYSGDANYATSTSATPQVITAQYLETFSASANPGTVTYGATSTLTATVVSPHLTPALAGTITFNPSGGNVTTSLTTDGNGNQILTATMSFVPQSTGYINVGYGGDPNYTDGQTNVFVTVNIPDFSLNIPSAPFNFTVGQPGTLQISVVPATNNSSPVMLSCNGNMPVGYSCSLQPSSVNLANGTASTATLTLSPSPSAVAPMRNAVAKKHVGAFLMPRGPNPLWPLSLLSGLAGLLSLRWARKRRDLRPSLGFGLVCIISLIIGCGGGSSAGPPPPPPPPPGPTATMATVTTSAAKVAQGSALTFTAKVTGAGNPTGAVSFYANGSYYGQANLTAGTATLNTSLAFPGIYSITAQYAGDTNNLPSTSPGVSEAVTGSTVMQVNGQTSTLFHSTNVTVTLQ